MGSGSSSVQKNEPYGPAKPMINKGLTHAEHMFTSDPNQFVVTPYGGKTMAPENPALAMARNNIINPDLMRENRYNLSQAQDAVRGIQGAKPTSSALDRGVEDAQKRTNAGAFNQGLSGAFAGPTGAFTQEVNQARNLGTDQNLGKAVGGTMQAGTTAALNQGVNVAQNGSFDNKFDSATRNVGSVDRTATRMAKSGAGSAYTPEFAQGVRQAQGVGVDPSLISAARRAGNFQTSGDLSRAVQMALNGGNNPSVSDAVDIGMQQGSTPQFRQGIDRAMNAGEDPRLTTAIRAQADGNADAFNLAVNSATRDPYGDDMRSRIADNVAESVMPRINGAFGAGGMAGSGLHAAAASKAMSSAMAPFELDAANRAQDRLMDAGSMAQGAHENRLARIMGAGQAGQATSDTGADRALQAGIASQSADAQSRNRALQAGGLAQSAGTQNIANALQAGQMSQDALMGRASLGLNAGQAMQDARMGAAGLSMDAGQAAANLSTDKRARELSAAGLMDQMASGAENRLLNAGQMRQAATDSARNRSLQAGQAMEGAQASLRSQQLAAGQSSADERQALAALGLDAGRLYQGAADTRASRGLQAGGMAQESLENFQNRSLQAGQAAQSGMLAGRHQSLQAAGMAPAMAEARYAPYDRIGEVGEARTQRAQQELAAEIMADQQRKAAPIDALNNYMNIVGNLGGQFGSSAATQQNNPGLLGILGAAAPILSLFSDRRLKTDIRRVGETDDGLPVYTFRYKAGGPVQMGVMAQDVERVNPEAVSVHESGFKMVDYGAVA